MNPLNFWMYLYYNVAVLKRFTSNITIFTWQLKLQGQGIGIENENVSIKHKH